MAISSVIPGSGFGIGSPVAPREFGQTTQFVQIALYAGSGANAIQHDFFLVQKIGGELEVRVARAGEQGQRSARSFLSSATR